MAQRRARAPSRPWLSHERYPRVLFALLAALSIALAIAPHDRADWLLENALLFGGVAVLVATHKALPLSRASHTLIFLFLCLHAVGAHYTYSLVPYDAWAAALTGRTISSLTGWQRNHSEGVSFYVASDQANFCRRVLPDAGSVQGLVEDDVKETL